jgi:hypothetical protein
MQICSRDAISHPSLAHHDKAHDPEKWTSGFRTKIMRHGKREAERRQAHAIHCPHHTSECRHPKVPGAEARLSVSALAYRRFAAALAPATERQDSAQAALHAKHDAKALPSLRFALKLSTPHAGRTAGRDDARTAREQAATLARRNRTRPMFRCASRTRPLPSEILRDVTEIGTIVKVLQPSEFKDK